MAARSADQSADRLRIIMFTNIPGGRAYTMVDAAVRPAGHRIVGVVTTSGPPKRRSDSYLDVVAAVPPGIDVIVTSHPSRLAAMLAPLAPDLIISGGFPWLIPEDVLTLPRLGTINLHPAPLPRYRGPFPIEWAFRNDDPELGFTVHRMAGAFDTGAILAQGHVPIHDDDEPGDVLGRLPPLMQALLGHAIERVIRGEPGDEQDDSRASYAGPFESEWRTIDWDQPARTIHNQVRSWTGIRDMPLGAIGAIDGEQVNVIRTRLIVGDGDSPASGSAGTVLRRDGDQLVVQCGDAPLELLNWTRVADTPA